MSIKASVIVSTYNQPKWLEKVLWGYECQTLKEFEIIIADDGSGPETKKLIDRFKSNGTLRIKHVWHEDRGFRKTIILNRAIQEAISDYIITTDGDCIPRKDYVETHLSMRKKGCLLSGGNVKLPLDISKKISKEDIVSQNCFDKNWLIKQGLKRSFKLNKLSAKGRWAWFLNKFTPTKATWDGNNASGWKRDILEVNGFDERMQYGGEDRELGERMMNRGIKPVQMRYSAKLVHLFHERGYVSEEMWKKNYAIRRETKKNRSTWTSYGILKERKS